MCKKNENKDDCYKLNLKRNETGLTKSVDVCHDCVKEKGILDLLADETWKKWNPKKFAYEKPE